jgi:glycerophosphoryl diester phosphodiesterase
MGETLQKAIMTVADWFMAVIPRSTPEPSALERCKIISHRGEHDNLQVFENTLPAFDIARDNGIWGIECDIRWTSDLVPVICHDADGARVFGDNTVVAKVTFAELRQRLPLIPSLQELIAKYGGSMHLMLELKAELFPQAEHQKTILQEALGNLAPGRDFHILALDPVLFDMVDFLPPHACLPVAELNVDRLSKASLEAAYGGITGHFLLLNNKLKNLHETAGQRIGTGFVASRNCLFRELNRGVEWIFSNDAVKIQAILDHCRNDGR